MKRISQGPFRGLFYCLWTAAALQMMCSCSGCSLDVFPQTAPRELSVLSYNLQNLFDDVKDGSEYYDYDPTGDDWNSDLYHLKLLQVSDVLSRYPEGGADIVLLQEIENRNVLNTLVTHYLKGCGYHNTCITAGSESAVNTAILSRYPIEEVMAHSVTLEGCVAGRPILECSISLGGHTLRLFNCHWKSKSGGAAETEPLRCASAAVLAARLRKIARQRPAVPVVVAGDLNECIDEWEQIEGAYATALMPLEGYLALAQAERRRCIGVTGEPRSAQLSGSSTVLISPWLMQPQAPGGSYAYRGEWETIDHFLCAPALCNSRGIEIDDFRVVRNERLLNEDGYPLRWISELGSGYSDHLPILLTLSLK